MGVHARARAAGQVGLPVEEMIICGALAANITVSNPVARLRLHAWGGWQEGACPEPLLTAAAWGACLMHPQNEGMMVSSSLVPGTAVMAIGGQ
jgi:hypothetical protein